MTASGLDNLDPAGYNGCVVATSCKTHLIPFESSPPRCEAVGDSLFLGPPAGPCGAFLCLAAGEELDLIFWSSWAVLEALEGRMCPFLKERD